MRRRRGRKGPRSFRGRKGRGRRLRKYGVSRGGVRL